MYSVLPCCWVDLVCRGLFYWAISAIQQDCIDLMMASVTVCHLVAQSLRVSSCWNQLFVINLLMSSQQVGHWWPEILLNSAYPYPSYRALELDVSRGAIIVTGNCCPGDGSSRCASDFRGGNYTSVLTGDSLGDSLWSFCPNSLMEYSRYFLIWLLSSPYSDFDSGPRTDEVPHNHVWLVIMKSII